MWVDQRVQWLYNYEARLLTQSKPAWVSTLPAGPSEIFQVPDE